MTGDIIEAQLHVQAMRLVCEALEYREKDGIEVDWNVLRQMHDQMDAMLQALQHKHRYDSSEIVDLRRDRDHWKQARDTAIEGGELLLKSNQTLQAEIETLRQQLDAAQAAVTLQHAGIERLQAFVGKVRAARDEHDGLDRDARVEAALDELDAGTEPTPVAEPLDAEGGA